MPTQNDITGDKLSSRVFTANGRENYDRIFRKLRPQEWMAELYPRSYIMDADGWSVDGVSYDSPISRSEFDTRVNASTVIWRT